MTGIANDFAAIQARLKEMKGDKRSEDDCPKCEGAGHVLSSYQAAGGPNFIECDVCYNPKGNPSP